MQTGIGFLQRLRQELRLARDALRHLRKARGRHRCFCVRINAKAYPEVYGKRLALLRERLAATRVSDGNRWGEDVLLCEMNEMLYEIARGNRGAAYDECMDCVAVLLRMAQMIKDEGESGG